MNPVKPLIIRLRMTPQGKRYALLLTEKNMARFSGSKLKLFNFFSPAK